MDRKVHLDETLPCSAENCGKLCIQSWARQGLTLAMATGHLAEEPENQAFWATGTHPAPCPQGWGFQLLLTSIRTRDQNKTVNQVGVSNPYQVLISEGQADKACPGYPRSVLQPCYLPAVTIGVQGHVIIAST